MSMVAVAEVLQNLPSDDIERLPSDPNAKTFLLTFCQESDYINYNDMGCLLTRYGICISTSIGLAMLPMYQQWEGIGTSKPDQCSTICVWGGGAAWGMRSWWVCPSDRLTGG